MLGLTNNLNPGIRLKIFCSERSNSRPSYPIHIVLTVAVAFLCNIFLSSSEAYAGTADRSGNNAEIYSISIAPGSVPAGIYPEIKGYVRNTASFKNGKEGSAVFDVVAVITLPNGSQNKLLWRNVSFSARQQKFYTFVNNYDIHQHGIYKIAYFVYNHGRTHLYTSLAKSFTVSGPAVISKPVSPPGAGKPTEVAKTGQTKKKPSAPPAKELEETLPQQTAAKLTIPSAHERLPRTETGGEGKMVGIGAYVNTFNFSGGPSLILWPLKNIALQGVYGFGTFTSYEARIFYRLPLSRRFHPYFGAGYLHTERKANVMGVDTKITGSSYTGFAGAELPLYKNLYGYIDVSATPIKLRKDIVNGTMQATATVKYSPVTVAVGLMLYLF